MTKSIETRPGSKWETQRNSSETVFKWKKFVDWKAVNRIQKECGEEVMKWLGYKFYTKEEYFQDQETPMFSDWAYKGQFYQIYNKKL